MVHLGSKDPSIQDSPKYQLPSLLAAGRELEARSFTTPLNSFVEPDVLDTSRHCNA
jgi:hypothetical protein